MERIEAEPIRVLCPAFADVLVRREASQGFQPLGKVVSREEGGEMPAKLIVAVVMIAADGGLFQRAVHALDLAVRQGMLRFCGRVIDTVFSEGPLKSGRQNNFPSR